MHLLKLLFFILASFSHNVHSRYYTAVIPITKDEQTSTSLYKVPFGLETLNPNDVVAYLIIDLDTPFLWKDIHITNSTIPCDEHDGCSNPVRCDTPLCKEAKSYINPICPLLNKTDCNNCTVTPLNPISKTCVISELTTDLLKPCTTDGRNPFPHPDPHFGGRFVLSCAPKSLDQYFPKDVRGVAGFSWSGLCLPRQLNSTGVTNTVKFALCLPSSSSDRGVTFVGEGPFYFTTNPNVDLRSYLSYTPMIRTSSKSLGYYIKINRILIKGTPVSSIPKGSSVKISSIVTYTKLRTEMYKALVATFSNATNGIPQVPAVKPFDLCLKESAIGSGGVPKIDLETEKGKVWSISGENLMKRFGNDATCLAFVDGGLKMKDAIVIGTFQMENNFLYFDLVNQMLGFSSSLLSRGTSCSGFNFTVIGK